MDTSRACGIALGFLVDAALADPSRWHPVAGFGAVAWMLITNVVFGIVMGNVYGRLIQRDRQRARAMSGMAAAH